MTSFCALRDPVRKQGDALIVSWHSLYVACCMCLAKEMGDESRELVEEMRSGGCVTAVMRTESPV